MDLGLDLIKCYTLIDITQTNVVQRYKKDGNSFTDNSGKLIETESDFDYSRNQQRNYETLLQVIGLRAQPVYTETPVEHNINLDNYEFGSYYTNPAKMWEFIFGVEHHLIFQSDTPFGALEDDINQVPVITGLSESILLPVSIFSATGELKNIYFEYVIHSD